MRVQGVRHHHVGWFSLVENSFQAVDDGGDQMSM
jgi:hypothetical protein